MPRLLDRLQEDHQHLAQVLDLLERILDRFHEGTEPDFEVLSDLLEYMEQYSDQIHHPTEDRIFERMRKYGDQHRGVVDVLSKQHEALREINKQFRASVEGIVHGEVLPRELVEAHGRDLVQTLRNHLDLEEKEAFPQALELLTESDWDELLEQSSASSDPIFGDRDPDRFRALYDQLLAESRT